MSTLALMRWLEGSPERYDAGMRAVTLGRVERLHEAIAEAAVLEPGERVLEVGCGTGSVTARLLARGGCVTAIDQAPEMLEQARRRLGDGAAEWREQTASEIDTLPEQGFDAVVLSLCLSDMSSSERSFVLRESAKRLAPCGRLVAGDEVHAPAGLPRILQLAWRLPQAVLGWLLVGSVSKPIPDLASELRSSGLRVVTERRWLLGTLAIFVAVPEP